jgi:hypothetical protein
MPKTTKTQTTPKKPTAAAAKVFLVQHTYAVDEREEVKNIGVYGSLREARAAVAHTVKLPGFKAHPKGFSIAPYELGLDSWQAGFVRM